MVIGFSHPDSNHFNVDNHAYEFTASQGTFQGLRTMYIYAEPYLIIRIADLSSALDVNNDMIISWACRRYLLSDSTHCAKGRG